MPVSDIMTAPAEALVCATLDETIASMASMIASHKVGALPVVDDDGGLRGMISERDIVRALALDGHAALTLKAAELMTRAVVTCKPGASYTVARNLMLKHRIRHLPVVDEQGELVGMLSQRDLVTLYGREERSGRAA